MNQKLAIWLPISPIWHIVVPTATATFAKSNETFSVSETPSSKVEDIEEESPKRKYFGESHYRCKYTFSGIFGEMLCPIWLNAVH